MSLQDILHKYCIEKKLEPKDSYYVYSNEKEMGFIWTSTKASSPSDNDLKMINKEEAKKERLKNKRQAVALVPMPVIPICDEKDVSLLEKKAVRGSIACFVDKDNSQKLKLMIYNGTKFLEIQP